MPDSSALARAHGSVGWGQQIQQTAAKPRSYSQSQAVIEDALFWTTTPNIQLMPNTESIRNQDGYYQVPAIAIPVDQKSNFVCPEDHLKELWVAMAATTKLLVVGWRATEQHFLDQMATHMGAVHFAVVDRGTKPTTDVRGRLLQAMSKGSTRDSDAFIDGFSHFVAAGSLHTFLEKANVARWYGPPPTR